MPDSYLTIKDCNTGEYSEKRSKFLAFAYHVETTDDVKLLVERHEREYYDARHVCYAYVLGHLRDQFRAVDNGEPSGTAGKPILGQLNKRQLTNTLVIVVRYFGGIKLGTSGLANAYKSAAACALDTAQIVENTVVHSLTVKFDYVQTKQVMRVIKDMTPKIIMQEFGNQCLMRLAIRQSLVEQLKRNLEQAGVRDINLD